MHGIVETTQTFRWRRSRLHVGSDTLVVDRNSVFGGEAAIAAALSYDQLAAATIRGGRRRVTLRLERRDGYPPVEIKSVPRTEAEWAVSLIADRVAARTRAGEPVFAQRLSFAQVQEHVNALLTNGGRRIVDLVDLVLLQAVYWGASDVHVEPFRTNLRVRFRIDGVLHDVLELPRTLQEPLLNRLKVVSNLRVADTGMPQEGRMVARTDEHSIDLRISTMPTLHGEKAAVRLFDPQRGMLALDELGMSGPVLTHWLSRIDQPQGTLLLTGPANSGKTTTMYASLLHLHETRRNLASIATVEDPVEYDLSIINQTQTNPAVGLTFAVGLRTLLRQDPEILMIGEVRDAETADIAVRAGLTGHLVFSTVHAKSPAAVFLRLVEMGVEPFLVASSVTAVLAQRLVRRNCPRCVQSYAPPADLLAKLGEPPRTDFDYRRGVGCRECGGTGYAGRVGLFELAPVTDTVHDLIMSRAPERALIHAIRESGVVSVRADGWAKVAAGRTTPEELLRVLGPT